jgi:hypothetical protein
MVVTIIASLQFAFQGEALEGWRSGSARLLEIWLYTCGGLARLPETSGDIVIARLVRLLETHDPWIMET